jgi:hypothetical protein
VNGGVLSRWCCGVEGWRWWQRGGLALVVAWRRGGRCGVAAWKWGYGWRGEGEWNEERENEMRL